MRGVPKISHLLEIADGGIDGCIQALRLSDDGDAQRFLEAYDATSESDRRRVTLEEISVSAGVPPRQLLAAAILAVQEMGKSAAAMASASLYAPVIRATAQAAIDGRNATSNRKLFLSGVGFLPRPISREPGSVFVNITNKNAEQAKALHEASEAPAPQQALPEPSGRPYSPAEDELRRLHSGADERKMLEAPREMVYEQGEGEELDCIPGGEE